MFFFLFKIICPVTFDQHHWGHVIEWKGLGKLINTGPPKLTKGQLKSTLLSIMNDDIKRNVRKMKELFDTENGETAAVKIIEQRMLLV